MDAPTLSYAQRRALNIARNAERMRAIGLTTIGVVAPSPALGDHRYRRVPAAKNKNRQLADGADPGEPVLRRSGRTTSESPLFLALFSRTSALTLLFHRHTYTQQ